MARTDHELKTKPSLLGRLLDFEPRMSTEPPKSKTKTISEIKSAVRRDLEWLLNTRQTASNISPDLEESQKSLAAFGLPDLTSLSVKNTVARKDLTNSVENAIRIFEPRLLNLKVTLEQSKNTDKHLKLRIEAILNTKPDPEPITFDTILEVGSGDFEVKEK